MLRYLKVECGDQQGVQTGEYRAAAVYIIMVRRFVSALSRGGPETRSFRASIMAGQDLIDRLAVLMKLVARESGNRKKKV